MAEKIEFVTNYSDQSTDNGFQFEFRCNRYGNGYKTPFKPWSLGSVSQVADGAGSMLGGLFSRAADVTQRAKSAAWEKARDKALVAAVTEMKPDFAQCPRCSSWVCRQQCWNDKRGLCKRCAPDLGVEMSAAQSDR